MPRFLFYTHEGETFTPYVENEWEEYDGGEAIENLQVIGFSQGNTPEEAFNNLLFNDRNLIETTFNELIAIELKEEEHVTYGFSLEGIRELQKDH